MKKKLVVISAPSGAGKTTLCKRLLSEFSEHMVLSVSSTTRPPRSNEINGRDYYFLSKKEFEREIANGFFAEWAAVHDHYYGTSIRVLDDAFAKNKTVVLDIDVQGAASLKASYREACLTVFVAPPSLDALEERLRKRNQDSEETIRKRLKNAAKEMSRMDEFEHTLINDHLDQAYSSLKEIVLQHIPELESD